MMATEHLRWIVTLTYRTDDGPLDIEHHVEELDEIADLVERGPDWNCLIKGEFVLNPLCTSTPGLTVEAQE